MKRMLTLLISTKLIFLAVAPLHASADNAFGKAWTDLQANSQFHFLDNLTPGLFYDFKQHEMMSGGTTEVYSYRYLSADFGVVRSIEQESNAIPTAGVKFKFGAWLDSIPAMHNLGTMLGLNQGILQYLTAGGWGARDFDQHEWRYGAYGGFLILFGGNSANAPSN